MPSEKPAADLWHENLHRDANDAPLVLPLYALEMGPGVHLVDLRRPAEAAGPLGCIPGSTFPEPAALDAAARSEDQLPLVLISADGVDAAALARRMETAGATRVAALAGGLAAWRAAGFLTARGEDALLRDLPMPSAHAGRGLAVTLESLRAHLADPRAVHWIQLASLMFHATQSCVDGRDGRGVIGTPGGDAGEFALLLAAVEQVTGTTLSEEAVEAAMLSHLDTFGDFYLHTDTHAITALRGELRADGRTAGATPEGSDPAEWTALLRNPPPGIRAALLEYLVATDHIGCGHLRLQIEHGDDYGVRPELVRAVIRSFFRLLWAGAPEIRPVILEGGHAETAVLSISMERDLWALSPIPIVSPAHRGRQMFVDHADVSAYLRRDAIKLQVRGGGPLSLSAAQGQAVAEASDELAGRQLTETLGHLAQGLPVFAATFAGDGSVEIEQVG